MSPGKLPRGARPRVVSGISPSGGSGAHPILEATGETFDALVLQPRGVLVVVDFWGPGCPNCEVFAAAAPRMLEALGDARLRLVKVNAYEHEALARRFGFVGIPTFLLFPDGVLLERMIEYRGADFWLSVVRERLPAR